MGIFDAKPGLHCSFVESALRDIAGGQSWTLSKGDRQPKNVEKTTSSWKSGGGISK